MSELCNSAPDGYVLRDCQVEALLELERSWDHYDVFIINAPVASGKSLQAISIAEWSKQRGQSTAILTPQVILQDQYTKEFTEIPSLKGRGRYCCSEDGYESCDDFFMTTEKYCIKCPYQAAKKAVKENPVGIYNLYSYLFDDGKSDILVVDEAHSIMSQLQEFYSIKL